MKAPNLSLRPEVSGPVASGRKNHNRRHTLIPIVSGILVLIAILSASFYLSVDVSASRDESPKPADSVAGFKPTAPLTRVLGAGLPSPLARTIAPMLTPQGPPISVTTYAGDCTTPKTVFNVRDADLTVCAKVTGGQPGWTILWSNAKFEIKQQTPLGSGESTFTLATTSNLGDWRVIAYEPLGGAVYSIKPFTVVDDDNPIVDLSIITDSGTSSITPSSQVLFSVQLTNLGPSDASTVEVTDSVPAGTTFSSFALVSGPAGTNCVNPIAGANSGTSTCTIPLLARGETALFVAAYDVTSGSGTTITNTAAVTSATDEVATAPETSSNNTSTYQVRVNGSTTEVCSLDCPANVVRTADTTSGGQPGAFINLPAASVSGSCGAVSNSPASGTFFPVGTHSIISSAELGGSCAFTVTVLDTNPPTISCPANITVTAPQSQTEATVSVGNPTINASGGGVVSGVRSDDIPATFDDNGNVVTPAVVHALTDPYPIGSTGILWTVTDAGGRTATCSQFINVVGFGDRDPVTISCPAHVTFTAPSGSCEATIPAATIGMPTSNPSDSNVQVVGRRSDDLPLTSPFPAGSTTVTWTASDRLEDGTILSTASCVQNVTVTAGGGGDTTPPVLTVPANLSVTTSSCSVILDDELGTAEATDTGACGGSVSVARTGVPAGFVFPTGTTTITYTATDAGGNMSTGTQTVTVTESPAVLPTITAPADLTVNTGPGATSCGTVVSDAALGTAIANDNCAGVTVTRTGVPAGNSFPVGTTTVTYTATDRSGNTATDTQVVTVIDTTPPTITAPADVTVNTGPTATSCDTVVSNAALGTPTTDDNCPGETVSRSPSGNTFPVGTTDVIWTVTDAAGNTATATQQVTVIDNTPPVVTPPANITVFLPLNSTAVSMVVNYPNPATATDNCPGTLNITYSPASGSTFFVGTTPVTASTTDAHGNPGSATFTVTVLYNFTGFFSPVDNLPTLNVVNAGRALPVKFSLSGNKGLNIFAADSPYTIGINCDGSAPQSDVEETVNAGGSSLTYDAASDRYHYVWKTENSWKNTCRQLVVTLNDGSEHKANFKFK
jgi:Domain of unknown function DUF11/HYR domain